MNRLGQYERTAANARNQITFGRSGAPSRLKGHALNQNGWRLEYCGAFNSAEVTWHGQLIGYIVGVSVESGTDRLAGSLVVDEYGATSRAAFEATLNALSGRFIGWFFDGNDHWLYPDASASLALLLIGRESREAGDEKMITAATSAALLDGLERRSSSQQEHLDLLGSQTTDLFPLAITPYVNAELLRANHSYDVNSGAMVRRWPVEPVPHSFVLPSAQSFKAVAERIGSVIAALVKTGPVVLNLSAGRDTRTLLACARQLPSATQSALRFETNARAGPDLEIASALATAYGLNLCVGKVGNVDQCVLAQGLAGEVARTFYARPEDFDLRQAITVEELLSRLGLEAAEPWVRARAEEWLTPIQHLPRLLVLDLAYIELRLGGTMGPVMTEYDARYRLSLYPMNNRTLFEFMLALDPKARAKATFYCRLLDTVAPDLRIFPINKSHFTGFEKYSVWLRLHSPSFTGPPEFRSLYKRLNRGRGLWRTIWDDALSVLRRCIGR